MNSRHAAPPRTCDLPALVLGYLEHGEPDLPPHRGAQAAAGERLTITAHERRRIVVAGPPASGKTRWARQVALAWPTAGAGVAVLTQQRHQWADLVGPLDVHTRAAALGSSIFDLLIVDEADLLNTDDLLAAVNGPHRVVIVLTFGWILAGLPVHDVWGGLWEQRSQPLARELEMYALERRCGAPRGAAIPRALPTLHAVNPADRSDSRTGPTALARQTLR